MAYHNSNIGFKLKEIIEDKLAESTNKFTSVAAWSKTKRLKKTTPTP